MHSIETQLNTATHQRDVVIEAVLKTAVDIGLYNPSIPVEGPQVLLFCEDFTKIINDQAAKIAALQGQLVELENEQLG